ncbi:hypothetical protein BSK63_31220 [Paenibacillus odorifer]|uniref:hypothetical protein n=1 Tax=Paenibacillus odorifer TaxID=189426 RepID=UPI00096D2291|nr:hypothetical protein [Paenibacillus odorifer]OME22213.1 hypothetical protein BSK63_31220 [Paenibacillus odorifer]OME37871.1 hypothetical protein BSK46_14165 [Paenibacillus odorifer]
MTKINVPQLAQETSARLEPVYRELVQTAYQAVADDDGSLSRTSAMTVEVEMLRQYLERYVSELVSEVVRQLDEA